VGFSIVGLILDVIGVVMLFRFGILPKEIFDSIILDNSIKDNTIKKHHLWSRVGISALILGFILQAIGVICSS